MKVIVANYRYFIAGGPEKYMFKFMDAAKKYDIEVIPFSIKSDKNVYTPYEKYFAKPRSNQLMYSDTKKNIKNLYGMFRAVVWNFNAKRQLSKLIKDENPDVIYILNEINHLSPSIIKAAKKANIKVVHRISDFFMLCPRYDFLCNNEICEACAKGNYKKAIENKCVKNSKSGTLLRVLAMKLYKVNKIFDKVDDFVCTCDFTMKKLMSYGIPQNKLHCIPTFIDCSLIQPNYSNDKYFLVLGRLAEQKGVIYAVEAMRFLKGSGYKLKITGNLSDGEYDKKILEIIEKYNLFDDIEFTGFKHGEELDKLINNSVCTICPAIWYENMPNTLIESYAHGKPVIASNIGSLKDLVIDGETGFLFEMKNPEDLSNKMIKFIKDKNLSSVIGRKSREFCLSEFNEELHMSKLIDVLKN